MSLVSIADMVISNFSTYIVYNVMALEVVTITDSLLTVVFLFDFSYRISTTSSKSTYFFKNWGWADLLACVPVLRIFRLFRIVRAARLLRTFGLKNMINESKNARLRAVDARSAARCSAQFRCDCPNPHQYRGRTRNSIGSAVF